MARNGYTVSIHLNEEQYVRLKEKARRMGIPASTLVRSAILGDNYLVYVPALIQDVRRVGILLGKILEHMEKGEQPGSEEVRKALEDCRAVEKQIFDAYAR